MNFLFEVFPFLEGFIRSSLPSIVNQFLELQVPIVFCIFNNLFTNLKSLPAQRNSLKTSFRIASETFVKIVFLYRLVTSFLSTNLRKHLHFYSSKNSPTDNLIYSLSECNVFSLSSAEKSLQHNVSTLTKKNIPKTIVISRLKEKAQCLS